MVTPKDYIRDIYVYERPYRKCEELSHKMKSSSKKGDFGKGCKNTPDDPRKVEREGKLGEAAFGLFYRLGEPDWTPYTYDLLDFLIYKSSLDVKMSRLVQISKERPNMNVHLPLKYDIYVSGEVEEDHRKEQWAKIKLFGWITKKEMYRLNREKIVRREYGKGNAWWNWRFVDEILRPMKSLETWFDELTKEGKLERIKVINKTEELWL